MKADILNALIDYKKYMKSCTYITCALEDVNEFNERIPTRDKISLCIAEVLLEQYS